MSLNHGPVWKYFAARRDARRHQEISKMSIIIFAPPSVNRQAEETEDANILLQPSRRPAESRRSKYSQWISPSEEAVAIHGGRAALCGRLLQSRFRRAGIIIIASASLASPPITAYAGVAGASQSANTYAASSAIRGGARPTPQRQR